jgi:hypothetical protein
VRVKTHVTHSSVLFREVCRFCQREP